VKLGQPLLLPSLVKPRVLAIEINDHGLLARLRALIINALRDSGVNIADRYLGDFKPHLTVAYVRVKVDPQYLMTLLSYVDLSTLPVRAIPVDRVSLVRAWGDNYTELVMYRLSCS
jgi:2'-5' RNA ligase